MWKVQFTDGRGIAALSIFPFERRSDAYQFLMREYSSVKFLEEVGGGYLYECSSSDGRGAYVLIYKSPQ